MKIEEKNIGLFWRLLVDRFKVTMLVIAVILIYGVIAFTTTPRELTPTIDIPVANITTVWPGASPGDIEKLVTNKIEKEIKNLDNVKEYTSSSLSGVSIITVEFDLDSDKTENMQKLRERVEIAKRNLPETLPGAPKVDEISMSDISIISLTLSGDFAWSELKQFAEKIEDQVKSVPQVKDVTISGAPKDQVNILINPIELEARKIGVEEVLQAIRGNHRDMPLGQINARGQRVEVSLKAEMKDPQEFMNLPIQTQNGATIRLGDIAEVRREYDVFEVETFFVDEKNTSPAILIDITKSASQGNVIKMVEECFKRIENLKQRGELPSSVNIGVIFNRGDEIKESMDTLKSNAWQTLLLIFIVMFLALGWRESLLASIAIPLSMLLAIISMYVRGDSFNGISLFALVLSIGLLVDNAIILVEGMHQAIHDKKLDPHLAAIDSIHTFRWPVITGTLTTIFAFLPMLFFITGISGQYISVIPNTVNAGLIGALFVCLLLLPSVGVRFYKIFPPKKVNEQKRFRTLQGWYGEKMQGILRSAKKTSLTLFLAIVAFIFSVGLLVTRTVPVELFPSSDENVFTAKIELPEGTKLEETKKMIPIVQQVFAPYMEGSALQEKWISSMVLIAGKSSDLVSRLEGRTLPKENILGMSVRLVNKEDRKEKSYNIIPILREKLTKSVPSYAKVTFAEQKGGPPTGAPIEIQVRGQEMERMDKIVDSLKKKVEKMEGPVDIRDSRAEKVTQLSWTIKRDILNRFGLSVAQIIEPLRTAVNGTTAVYITEGDEEIDVVARIDWTGEKKWQSPESLDILNRVPIKIRNGDFIPFSQIAEAKLSSELSNISHKNGERIMYVRADLKKGIPASLLEPEIKRAIQETEKTSKESISIGGENEEGNRIIYEMLLAMSAAVVLIFITLVWQFNSFVQAFIILAIIPFSLTGVFVGFWILGLPVSFPTMIGIVSLAGIIVNDAIVLIDTINHQHHTKGLSLIDAYIQAGKDRMQAIFLTSLTTVVGLIPLSLSDEVWAGLGFAIVFGMCLSTVLTLILVPCMLITVKRIQRKINHLLGRHTEIF